MTECWVVNASPLIVLARISRLDFLENLAPCFLEHTAVLDHQAGRICAQAHGVPSMGTLGIILLAQQRDSSPKHVL
ncbi:MAG: hypothetical protein IT490_00425 [Candidatus Contendobacter sp.]|nr:hypothetical protein [Candidatus Contendobacter sp.]